MGSVNTDRQRQRNRDRETRQRQGDRDRESMHACFCICMYLFMYVDRNSNLPFFGAISFFPIFFTKISFFNFQKLREFFKKPVLSFFLGRICNTNQCNKTYILQRYCYFSSQSPSRTSFLSRL